MPDKKDIMTNYRKRYNAIIKRGKQRTRDIAGQWHHIKPRCIGGTDEPKNLVKLTYKEHFYCHYLLTKIYPHVCGIHKAYFFMANVCGEKISAKQYEESMQIFVEEMREKTGKWSKELWNSKKKTKVITINGKEKKVTFKEYMAWIRAKQDMSFMKNKSLQKNCNKNKCLRFMWRYLSENNITELTDDIIRNGWKTRRNKNKTNTWKKFYKTFKEWKAALVDYLKDNPIDPNFKYSHYVSPEGIIKRGKTRVLNVFKQMWKDGRIINNDYISARYYYKKGRCYRSIKWKKYYTEEEWIIAIHDTIIDNQ